RRGVRTGDGEHLRVRRLHEGPAVLRAQAAGEDDFAVFRQSLADGRQRLLDSRVDEPASVHEPEIGAVVARSDRVALRALLRQDTLRVVQRLRTAERNEADARNGWGAGLHGWIEACALREISTLQCSDCAALAQTGESALLVVVGRGGTGRAEAWKGKG